ncbi:DUF1491 family protein [Novosphingobium album (ex Hu et al. 2023)]|uniref:DUF1491 family protein n=1 Tax=Novosphingobium album (ex Hu et al. 2023) TaxID=2930093 RepID=A0ABT0B4E9_9SPHN|nr:DUF1491 family protein [Novosphingobium album (ex Hu et al. 2023)]MCJ2179903.1 DUF1491 family protein [Novosphingobium album (ex Hu et al. 2023)]
MDARLPAHLEVAAMIRAVEVAGGFAMIVNKGERDAGTIMVVTTEKGENSQAYERMPQIDGTRQWQCVKKQDTENKYEFSDYLSRRRDQDPDLWIVELDIAQGERFIGLN